ncbi:MAG TPA: hypothetical protein EYQ42_01320 [Thiotrichaceae bacterium]|jgi:hypothetical protein|nr:hypothetical protein [Thiotrichaceae bacterium]
MPQLPSGRHVGVGSDPLIDLVEDFTSGKNFSCWRFLAIDDVKDLYPYIEIFYFDFIEDGDRPKLKDHSLPIDAGLKKIETGLRVPDVFKDNSDWSEDDKVAFLEFLQSERFTKSFNRQLDTIKMIKADITLYGSEFQKAEVALWNNNIHWLQEKH